MTNSPMTALNKQAGACDVSPKTYYIHPAAFGGTKDPGHGHVPVVKADDFEKLRAKLEAAEARIAELTGKPAEEYADDGELLFEIDFCDDLSTSIQTAQWLKELRIRRAAGIGVKGE